MTQAELFPDADPDLSRGRNNPHSKATHEKIRERKPGTRDMVRVLIAGSFKTGMTLEQICAALHKLPHQVSGRISELKQEGKIVAKPLAEGMTAGKNSCAVYVTPENLF